MKLFGEFKKFISRGNVMDLAVGVIIGSAFTAIVTSLVNDILMPVIGWLFQGRSFTELRVVITPATEQTEEIAIRYGSFLQAALYFLLIAAVVFLLVKIVSRLTEKKKEAEPAPPPAPSEEIVLLREIRDSLRKTGEASD